MGWPAAVCGGGQAAGALLSWKLLLGIVRVGKMLACFILEKKLLHYRHLKLPALPGTLCPDALTPHINHPMQRSGFCLN